MVHFEYKWLDDFIWKLNNIRISTHYDVYNMCNKYGKTEKISIETRKKVEEE